MEEPYKELAEAQRERERRAALAHIQAVTGWNEIAAETARMMLHDTGHRVDKFIPPDRDPRISADVMKVVTDAGHLGTVSGRDPAGIWAEIHRASSTASKVDSQRSANVRSGWGHPPSDEADCAAAYRALAARWRELAGALSEPWNKLAAHYAAETFRLRADEHERNAHRLTQEEKTRRAADRAGRPDAGTPRADSVPGMSLELPPETRNRTGYRYASRVRFLHDGAFCGSALLFGDAPYTAGTVAAELTARGYPVQGVAADGRSGWKIQVSTFQSHERYQLWVDPRDWTCWRTLRGEGITWSLVHQQWIKLWRRQDDDDDERYPAISRAQAERLAPAFGTELPDATALIELREHAYARAKKSWSRPKQDRTAQFASRRRELARYAAGLPAPVRDTSPMPVGRDEPFPLLRVTDLAEFPGTQLHVLVNRVTIDGDHMQLTAWLRSGALEYQAVTPFCPDEGYQLDAADHDTTARAAKLDTLYQGRFADTFEAFPASPARLSIVTENSQAEPPWLELEFPDGAAYLASPTPFRRSGHDLAYERFVPAHASPLAVVPGIAPEWVSLLVPRQPALLAAVTARFRHYPDRAHPGPPGYIEM